MSDTKAWDEPKRDLSSGELLEYLLPEVIEENDDIIRNRKPDDPEFATMTHYVGDVLWWIIEWYGSWDDRSRYRYMATDSMGRIMLGDKYQDARNKRMMEDSE